MPDRQDWLALRKGQKKEALNGQRYNLEFLTQAEVHQKNLTNQPEWDRFLTYLQARIDELQEARSLLKDQLCDIRIVDTNDIMAMKMSLVRADALIEGLEAVIALPKQIMDSGEKAREALSSLTIDS